MVTAKSHSEETIKNIEFIQRAKENSAKQVGGMIGSLSVPNTVFVNDSAALENFGIMLLDIDNVDYLDLSVSPNQRFVYKMRIPDRTYGRISGLEWDVFRVTA
jgi:hypothetical protein